MMLACCRIVWQLTYLKEIFRARSRTAFPPIRVKCLVWDSALWRRDSTSELICQSPRSDLRNLSSKDETAVPIAHPRQVANWGYRVMTRCGMKFVSMKTSTVLYVLCIIKNEKRRCKWVMLPCCRIVWRLTYLKLFSRHLIDPLFYFVTKWDEYWE